MPEYNYSDNDSYNEYLPLSEEELLEETKKAVRSYPNLRTFFALGQRDENNIVLPTGEIPDASYRDALIELEAPNEFGVRLLLDESADHRSLGDSYLLPARNPVVGEWIAEQEAYIAALKPRERHAIRVYTHHGDFLVNGFLRSSIGEELNAEIIQLLLRKGEDNPLLYAIEECYDYLRKKGLQLPYREELWVRPANTINAEKINGIMETNRDFFLRRDNIAPLIVSLVAQIAHVIYSAPRPRAPMRVYRGVATEHLAVGKRTIEFWSTSLNPWTSWGFTEPYLRGQLNGILYEIEVPANIPCFYCQKLTQFESNYEVLFPPGLHLKIERVLLIKRVTEIPQTTDDFLAYAKNPREVSHVLCTNLTVNGWNPRVQSLAEVHEDWVALRRWSREKKTRQTRKLETLRLTTRTLVPKTKIGRNVKSRWSKGSRNSSARERNRNKQRNLNRKTRRKVKFAIEKY